MQEEYQEIVDYFHEAHTLIKKYRQKKFDKMGITLPQALILNQLASNGACKISDLSSQFNLSNSTISGIVDRLEKNGMVERKRSTRDRRIVNVDLSPEFAKNHRKNHINSDAIVDAILKKRSAEEIRTIKEGLKLLTESMADYFTAAESDITKE